jgi:hypothetical protein
MMHDVANVLCVYYKIKLTMHINVCTNNNAH